MDHDVDGRKPNINGARVQFGAMTLIAYANESIDLMSLRAETPVWW